MEATSSIPESIKASSHSTVLQAIAKSQLPSTSTTTSTNSGSDEPPKETLDAGLLDPRESVTVFSDAANFNVKHPLYSTWQLWFDSASKSDKTKAWEEALVKVSAFSSVEEFWGLYNNIVPPSLIHANSNYYLFKDGIKPAWEDKANSKGGKWSVQLPRGKYSDQIDGFWLNTMLASIGETFETPFDPTLSTVATPLPSSFSDEVTGVIVSARKAFFRINIWTRNSSTPDKARIEEIGKHFKFGILSFEQGIKFAERDKVSSDVEFVSHANSQAKYGVQVEKWHV